MYQKEGGWSAMKILGKKFLLRHYLGKIHPNLSSLEAASWDLDTSGCLNDTLGDFRQQTPQTLSICSS